MRLLCLLASALLLGAAEPTKPNFVFVLIDDMGWGDFSCFGNQEAKTPNIDRLAADPAEAKNLAAAEPERVKAMRTRLAELLKDAVPSGVR